MKNLIDIIQEKVLINKDTKPQKRVIRDRYFDPGTIDKYVTAINQEIGHIGYMAINKSNNAIWIFDKGTSQRSMTLKNLICAVNTKTYIQWGPNENLRSKLEEPILNAIQTVDE